MSNLSAAVPEFVVQLHLPTEGLSVFAARMDRYGDRLGFHTGEIP